MKAFKDEFTDFYKKYYQKKGVVLKPDSEYEIGPFELFVIEKLAIMKINAQLSMVRMENRVKELMNEFIDKVNDAFGEEEVVDDTNPDV
jgi:hypothetical protein